MGAAERANKKEGLSFLQRILPREEVPSPAEAAAEAADPGPQDLPSVATRNQIQMLMNLSAETDARMKEIKFGGKTANPTGLMLAIYTNQAETNKALAFILDELLFMRTGKREIQIRRVTSDVGVSAPRT
jgi:hypothetical protein